MSESIRFEEMEKDLGGGFLAFRHNYPLVVVRRDPENPGLWIANGSGRGLFARCASRIEAVRNVHAAWDRDPPNRY